MNLMNMEKNIMVMTTNYYLKVNIIMEKEMEMEKNLMMSAELYLKANIIMAKEMDMEKNMS